MIMTSDTIEKKADFYSNCKFIYLFGRGVVSLFPWILFKNQMPEQMYSLLACSSLQVHKIIESEMKCQ